MIAPLPCNQAVQLLQGLPWDVNLDLTVIERQFVLPLSNLGRNYP